LVGIAVLLLTAWLAIPPLLKSQAQTRGTEWLGRTVSIGDVAFEPWRLALTVRDVAIGPAAGAASAPPLFKLGSVRAVVSMSSLWQRAPVIESLRIDSPHLNLTRTAEGHYDVDDLIARLAALPAPAADAEPSRFALYNLELRNGSLRFDDRPVGRVQQVGDLAVGLPFLSNLPSDIEVKVQPFVEFKLNGAAFSTGGQAKPFAKAREADLQFKLAPLDARPYLGYLPASLPVRPTAARLAAELRLDFQQPPADGGAARPKVQLSGWVAATDLALAEPAGAPLLGWRELRIGLRDVRPLERHVGLSELRLDGARLSARRAADGRINVLELAGPGAPAPAADGAANAPTASASTPTAGASAWHLELDTLELKDAQLDWADAAVRPAAELRLQDIGLKLGPLRWPDPAPMPLRATLTLQGSAPAPLGGLVIEGQASDRQATLNLQLDHLVLDALAPYLADMLLPKASGQLSAQAELDWSAAADAPRLKIALPEASLSGFALTDAPARGARSRPAATTLQQFAIQGASVDLLARQAQLGSIRLTRPMLHLQREASGPWNVERWVLPGAGAEPGAAARRGGPPAAGAAAQATRRTAKAGPAEPVWSVKLKDLSLEGGRISVSDAAAGPGRAQAPWRLEVDALRLRVQDAAWPAPGGAPIRLQAAARLAAPAAPGAAAASIKGGTIDWSGRLGLAPLQASGVLRIARLPVPLFAPFYAEHLPLHLQSAELSGPTQLSLRLDPAGLHLSTTGDLHVDELQLLAPGTDASPDDGDELLSWQSLALDGLAVKLAPGALPQVDIRGVTLADFHARLLVTEQGKLNLQSAVAAPAAASAAGAGSEPAVAPASATPAASAASAPAPGLPLELNVGPTRLVNGRIDFSDHFIRPNYSTRLTELNGQLGAFRSGTREMATLDLRGKAEGTALLEIAGQLNPTANPLALDIHAKASDLELAPLSAYSGKYAGYAIERGKLSMDVSYRIDPDGKLEAKNQVVLNQLTFGDKVESPDATKLPVLLAVALLKDRNGVIDINLPISRSLNDPQFSVGGIIVKIIVNLLTKAFTAPFALLSGGGGPDLSVVPFQPGTAQMTEAGALALDKVAKALTDRPSLTMTVTGTADAAVERDDALREALQARLVAERRRELARGGARPADDAPIVLSAEDRTRLVGEVYRQAKLPNKPRNAIGMAKDIPGAEMEALLRQSMVVDADTMRELALQRGVAVRDALVARGLPVGRLFLAAPRLHAPGEGDGAWSPRAQLSLAVH
jgi:uncharacterized protein involved in outer membrane biogenesis